MNDLKREHLEHIIRASGAFTNQYEFVIVGSQSMLGSVPNPPDAFTVSIATDIYPLQSPELANEIDGAIGEGSAFHRSHGYFAQGVGPDTAVLPRDWRTRVHRVQNENTNECVGYCLDVVDLFLSKAAAGREKDREFCIALLEHGYVSPAPLLALVPSMPLNNEKRRALNATIRRWTRFLRETGKDIADA